MAGQKLTASKLTKQKLIEQRAMADQAKSRVHTGADYSSLLVRDRRGGGRGEVEAGVGGVERKSTFVFEHLVCLFLVFVRSFVRLLLCAFICSFICLYICLFVCFGAVNVSHECNYSEKFTCCHSEIEIAD